MARISPLVHKDPSASDDALASEAAEHLAQHPQLQFVAELLVALRERALPWWTPEQRREALSATDRMRSFAQRPDIRATVMIEVAKAPPNFARRGKPDFQASILDEYMESPEDLSAEAFEKGFKPSDLVVYGDVESLYFQFRDAMKWGDHNETHQALIADLIAALLKDRGTHGGKALKSILSPWDVVNAIDPVLWHGKIPLEMRAAMHTAWLTKEKDKPRDAFHARDALNIITPSIITQHIALENLIGIFALAESKMGFERPAPKEAESVPVPMVEPTDGAEGEDPPKA